MKHRTAYLLWMLFLLIALGLGLWLSIESWQGKLPDPVRGLDELLHSLVPGLPGA